MKDPFLSFGKWRGFIVPGTVIVGILISLFLIVSPAYNAIKTTNAAIKTQQAKLDFLTQKVIDLQKLDPEAVDSRLALMEKAIPSDKNALSGLALLQTLATKTGVSVDNISVSPGIVSTNSASQANVQTSNDLVFKGTLSGSIDQLLNFFDAITQPTFPLFLPTKIGVSGGSGQESGSIAFNMLWLPQPSSFGGQDKPVAILTPREESLVSWVERNAANAPSGLIQLNQPGPSTASARATLF